MLTTYERRLILSYLINAVRHLHRGTSDMKALSEWVSVNSALLGLKSLLVELCRARTRRGKPRGSLSKNESGEVRDLLTVRCIRRSTQGPGADLLAALTPGDSAVVHRMAEVLRRLEDSEALTALLRTECDAKPDRPQPIGFYP